MTDNDAWNEIVCALNDASYAGEWSDLAEEILATLKKHKPELYGDHIEWCKTNENPYV